MNTKEAIKFVQWAEDVFFMWNELEEPNIEFIKQGNKVIELLQRSEKFEQIMIVKDNRCVIQYKVKDRILKFEKELVKLFKDNGFKFIGSVFDMCGGVRDLCFEEIIKGKNKKLEKELIEQSKETAKLNLEICKEFKYVDGENL